MHDTALRIGALAMKTYTELATARILEIGSSNVNGSLRDHAAPTTKYVGIDLEAGPGVDIVVGPGESLPVPDDDFDLVIASSVLEHDPVFWMTFVEMCRKTRTGGYIYLNVPSNGVVHQYPSDNWRFYPDSGRALVTWATSQGLAITLVESFVAERQDDIWNDFVAVFRKGDSRKPLSGPLLHEQIASSNIWVENHIEVLRPRAETEDMVLMHGARQDAEALRATIAQTEQEVEQLKTHSQEDRHRLADLESTLRQRQEEISQTVAELATTRETVATLTTDAEGLAEREAVLTRKLAEENAWVFRLAAERQVAEKAAADARARQIDAERQLNSSFAQVDRLEKRLVVIQSQAAQALADARLHAEDASEKNALEIALADTQLALAELRSRADSRLTERFAETAMLTRLLGEQQDELARDSEKTDWLRQINIEMVTRPWWWNLMPKQWRKRRIDGRLLRKGLFNGPAYLARYPDVTADGMDPLRHYILHGMSEDRSLPR